VSKSKPESKNLIGYGLYLIAAFLWGINGTVSKILLDTKIDPARLSQLRVTLAWLVLFVVIAVINRKALRFNSMQEFKLIAMYGVLGVTMTQWLYFVAIHLLPVGVALIIEFTSPLMVAVWVKFVWNHHVPRFTWVGLAIAIFGLFLVTQVWQGFSLNPIGIISGFGAAAALSLYFVTGEKILHLDKPRDSLSLTMWGFFFATAFWAIFKPWWDFPWSYLQGDANLNGIIAPQFVLVIWMVILGTVIPFWLALAAMKFISSQQASATGMTEPIFASVIAWIVMSESLTPWQLVGGAITLTGIAVGENARR
jgi:drug/metabolite transporter (DMT)-like permease